METFYVYLWTNKNNGKRYVGKGNGNRAWDHVSDSSQESPISAIAQAMKKHGVENFELTFLLKNLEESIAFQWEIFFIQSYGTKIGSEIGWGYNKTDGGEGISNPSPETRQKISEAKRGKKLSPQHRQKIGEASRNRSPETRQKLSEVGRGKTPSPETRRKLSEANRGKTRSSETRQKIGEAQRNRSPQHRQKIGEANRRRGSTNRLRKQWKAILSDSRLPGLLESIMNDKRAP